MASTKSSHFRYKKLDLYKYPLAEKYGDFSYRYEYELTNNAINRYQRYLKATSKDVLLASANKGLRYNALATPMGATKNLIKTAYAKIVTNEDNKTAVELIWPASNVMYTYEKKAAKNLTTKKIYTKYIRHQRTFFYAYIQNENKKFRHPNGGGPGFMEKAAERTRRFFMAELRKRLS